MRNARTPDVEFCWLCVLRDAQNQKGRDCVASGGLETAPPSYTSATFTVFFTGVLFRG